MITARITQSTFQINRVQYEVIKRAIKIKTVFAAILILTLFTTGYAQSFDKTKLDQFFDRLAEKNKAMGSLVIAKGGSEIYSRSIGYSQIGGTEKKPLTAATKYRIGSVTKMFTAAMIFQLIEENKLKLTDTLSKFFPQIPNANKITIANILGHRSGIHDFSGDPDYRDWRMNAKTKDEILAIIAKGTPDFEPDTKYAYSNAGYVVLGFIIEKARGKSYQEALKERITSKLGLKDTYLGTGNADAARNESYSYRYVRDWEKHPETHLSISSGAGALISTPTDMAKFIHSLFNGKIISPENLNQMIEHKMAMETFTYNGKTFYGHTGGIDNYGAWLVYLPEEKLALAYATNAKVYPVTNIIDGAFDIYYNKPFTIPSFEEITISSEMLDKYVGVYSSAGAAVKFTITRDSAALFVQMNDRPAARLEATAQDKFKIEQGEIVIEFDVAKNQMILKRSGGEKIFTKEK